MGIKIYIDDYDDKFETFLTTKYEGNCKCKIDEQIYSFIFSRIISDLCIDDENFKIFKESIKDEISENFKSIIKKYKIEDEDNKEIKIQPASPAFDFYETGSFHSNYNESAFLFLKYSEICKIFWYPTTPLLLALEQIWQFAFKINDKFAVIGGKAGNGKKIENIQYWEIHGEKGCLKLLKKYIYRQNLEHMNDRIIMIERKL